MEIKDNRTPVDGEGLRLEDLEYGTIVHGVATGTFYYVAEHHGGSPRKRLINLGKKCLQDMNYTGGRYIRVDAELVILATEGIPRQS